MKFAKAHLPALKHLGIAVEHFPRYLNRRPTPHWLDVVLISFVLQGKGRHVIDGEEYAETGASLAVTHYGQKHYMITDPPGMNIINVYLDLKHHSLPVLPVDLQRVLPLLLPLHASFQHRLNRIVRLQFEDPLSLAEHLFAIRDELLAREAGYREVVELRWKLFLIACCREAIARGFVREQGEARPALEDLRQYLDHSFAETHTLDALAKRARFSRSGLCRAFKVYTGKRIFDYLMDRRIQAAMIRLRGGNEKILTVALECGFNDLAYFNRKFKAATGETPTGYRREIKLP